MRGTSANNSRRHLHVPMRMRASAFTLVELMIVVVILGILASIVLPQFSDASHQARENTLKDELRYIRTQITVFTAQHRDVPPGYPDGDVTKAPADDSAFVAQMTKFTSEDCEVSDTRDDTYKFGPYLTRIPPNPISGKTGVRVVVGDAEPTTDDDAGWIYNIETRQFFANLAGTDSNGVAYMSY